MELNLDTPHGQLFIRSVDAEGIRIEDETYTGTIIISGDQVLPDWQVDKFEEIDEATLQVIFEMQPELVLIGCGTKQTFLPPAIQVLFLQRSIGIEVMTTDAACRTFNVLVAEGRQVVAALLPANP